MANTAPKVAAEERQEAPEAIDEKAEALATQMRKSKHLIVFTGAGISTSAGIPDFRGPEGVWTLRAQGRRRADAVDTLQAVPTLTHMALVELQNRGMLKYLISQNCDGLHRRSGILPDKISELHGNNNREQCRDCGKEYIRDFRAVATYEKTVHDHRTGRKCARCGGTLVDSIVNFGEALPAEALRPPRTCASEIPEAVGRRRRAALAICNLQETPLDGLARLRVRARADDLMRRAMARLGLPVPPFVLRRRLAVRVEPDAPPATHRQLRVSGLDVDGTPATFLHSVKLEYNRRVARAEPFVIQLRGDLDPGAQLKLVLEFMGHYGEPNLDLTYEYGGDGADAQALYLLEYNPQTGEWRTSRLESLDADGDGTAAAAAAAQEEDAGGVSTRSETLPNAVANRPAPEVIVID
ncbi:NAD-dependent deacetylase sirtuin-7 [Durotheca rogersii]|uniref:NAD-dependent deacetylase sirtuin-7 n=1 Tax=Durotheca rogersii TaxID=419775 RepID=UPI00222102E3|nr:NAD-dependent deacetylase sirtuin-7 [Durotheca rogersii]KAI5865144.1 NAD-dependent deacetylase sirtuin-7 [Durotheca rogersii]